MPTWYTKTGADTAIAAAVTSVAAPIYFWRKSGGAYPALPGSAPAGVKEVKAEGDISPAAAGATIPSWIDGTTVVLSYEVVGTLT